MGNDTQFNQDSDGGASRHWDDNFYGNDTIVNKSNYNSNMSDLKYAVFTQGHPSDAAKCKYSVEVLINYIQREYYAGIWVFPAPYENLISVSTI